MLLRDLLLDANQITTRLAATERFAAIEELVAVLVAAGRVAAADAAAITAAVRDREETMSTGIGHGVAIPHAATERVGAVEAALGIAPHDVAFDALDGKPVRIVFLLVVPANSFQQHLDTLADVARVLSDAELREQLQAAMQPSAVLALLRAKGGDGDGG